MFVENEIGGTVTVVNATSLDPFTNLSLSFSPTAGVVDPNDGALVVGGPNGTGGTQLEGIGDTTHAVLFQQGESWPSPGLWSFAYDPDAAAILTTVGPQVLALVPTTGASLGVAAQGACPEGLSFAAAPGAVYITDFCTDRTFSVEASTFAALASLRSGGQATTVYDDPLTGTVWTNDLVGQVVRSLDGANLTSPSVVPSGSQPVAVTGASTISSDLVLSQGSVAAGSSGGNASVETIPDGSSSGTFQFLPSGPTPLSFAVDGGRAQIDVSQVTSNGTNWVLQLRQYGLSDLTILATTNVSILPGSYNIEAGQYAAVLVLPNSTTVAVTDPGQGQLFGVDVANGSVAWSSRLDGPAVGLAYDPVDKTILVATDSASTLDAVDPTTGTVLGTAILQENATGVAFDPLNHRAYVAENDKASEIGGQVESFNAASLLNEQFVSGFSARLGGLAFLHDSGLIGVAGQSTGLLYLLGQGLSTPSLSASPSSLVVGQTTTLTASAKGGYLPYNISYSGLPPGCPSANTTRLACTPDHAGTYTVTVQFQDLTGAIVSVNTSVIAAPPPVTPGIDLASGSPVGGTTQAATLGDNVSLSASVESLGVVQLGSGTLLNWTIAPITNGTLNSSHGRTVTVSFFDEGQLTVILTAFFDGTTNSSSVVFNVAPGVTTHPAPSSGGIPILDLILAAIAVVVVVAAVVAVVVSRRGGGSVPPEEPEAASEPTPESAPEPGPEGPPPG
jgi:hypothetical protein